MKILLVGAQIESAMFILSNADKDLVTIVNMYTMPPGSLESFIEICDQSYIDGVINVYNRTPWSELMYLKNLDKNSHIVKVARMCSWTPDVIVYIYNKNYRIDSGTSQVISSDNIPIYSINSDDRSFAMNLKLLFRNINLKNSFNKV